MYELIRMLIDDVLMGDFAPITTAFLVISIGFTLLAILTDGESEP